MPSASVIVRVTGGGAAGVCGDDGRGSRRDRLTRDAAPMSRAGTADAEACPAAADTDPVAAAFPVAVFGSAATATDADRPASAVTTDPDTAGRGGSGGRGGCPTPGRADAAPAAPLAATAGRPDAGRQRDVRRAAPDVEPSAVRASVGSGGVGVVGRCSSMRRRIVGGTRRPAPRVSAAPALAAPRRPA